MNSGGNILRTVVLSLAVFCGAPAMAGRDTTDLNCDTNGRGGRDLSDAVYLFNWLFLGGPGPVALVGDGSLVNGDCNGDRLRDLADPVYLLNWLFLGGDAPVSGGASALAPSTSAP